MKSGFKQVAGAQGESPQMARDGGRSVKRAEGARRNRVGVGSALRQRSKALANQGELRAAAFIFVGLFATLGQARADVWPDDACFSAAPLLRKVDSDYIAKLSEQEKELLSIYRNGLLSDTIYMLPRVSQVNFPGSAKLLFPNTECKNGCVGAIIYKDEQQAKMKYFHYESSIVYTVLAFRESCKESEAKDECVKHGLPAIVLMGKDQNKLIFISAKSGMEDQGVFEKTIPPRNILLPDNAGTSQAQFSFFTECLLNGQGSSHMFPAP